MRTLKYVTSVAILTFLAMSANFVQAETAPGMQDLIGMRGSSLENAMTDKGYTFVKNQGAATMWWSQSASRCASVLVSNGRVDSIQAASARDCGRADGPSMGGSSKPASIQDACTREADRRWHLRPGTTHFGNTSSPNGGQTYEVEIQGGGRSGICTVDDNLRVHSIRGGGGNSSSAGSSKPASIQDACTREADRRWHLRPGTTHFGNTSSPNGGQTYEVQIQGGGRSGVCTVDDNLRVHSIRGGGGR